MESPSVIDNTPFPMSVFAMMLFGLSDMLDSGQHDNINFETIKAHIHRGDLFDYLKTINGGYFASNFFDSMPKFKIWYTKKIAENCAAMEGRERRKYGIERKGLCLLVSYTAEILQHCEDIDCTPLQ